ncbi:PBSX family phage terminase large subunit [Candidatus Babeliales bacterium]|nr:PBSX family phage terminase large subunit [Candidatus Babeliales bacterium]
MNEIRFPKAYIPLDDPYRYKVMWGGRGSAKSWTVARKLLIRGGQSKMRILCTRELQKSIKQSVHKLLSMQIDRMGLSSFYTVTNDRIVGKNGTEFIFLGVKHNTEEIKSTEAIDVCWIEEGHSLTEKSWDIIDPTIRQEGSEIWITYNTRFKFDHLHRMFVINEPPPDSWVVHVNHDANPFFPEVLKKQMETMKERDHEKYRHVWQGELKQLAEGAIFGKQIAQVHKDHRLLSIPVQKNCPVMTFMDLGKNDETAIWLMQRVGMEYHFIDYFQGRLEEVEHYTKFIRSQDYLYGNHYLPHDADHDRLGMKRNIKEQFEDGGVKPAIVVPRISHKSTAIELARDIFPNCYFHKGNDERGKRIEKGYEALCNYRYKYKEDDDVYHQTPHHDWASNGADAFMTFAQSDLNIDDAPVTLNFASRY